MATAYVTMSRACAALRDARGCKVIYFEVSYAGSPEEAEARARLVTSREQPKCSYTWPATETRAQRFLPDGNPNPENSNPSIIGLAGFKRTGKHLCQTRMAFAEP